MPGMTWIPRRRLIVLTAAAALVFSAAAAVAGVMLARSDNAAEAKATPPRAATFTVYATMALTLGQFEHQPGQGCWGRGGYDDIAEGGQVVVSDATGATVGVGRLADARYDEFRGRCTFTIIIKGVRDGGQFYSIEVTHRGKVQYSRSDLEKTVTLSVG